MGERLDRSFRLLRASGAILLQHRGLLIFPLLSSISVLLLLAAFILPMGGIHALAALSGHGKSLTAAQSAALFAFYMIQYVVIFFFNTALVGAVMMQVEGDNPTVADGLRIAASRLGPILGYAFIAATIGMLLHLLKERLGVLGRLVVGLLGVGWTLATYLVVPILAWRECGPIDAITESAELFKRTWGEGFIGVGGLSMAFSAILLGIVGCGALMIGVCNCLLHSASLAILTAIVVSGAVVLTCLVHATLSGIYKVALFRYAHGFGGLPGFDARALEDAFQRA